MTKASIDEELLTGSLPDYCAETLGFACQLQHSADPGDGAALRTKLAQLFEGGATKVGIATHDPLLVDHALEAIAQYDVDASRYEFQMLLGVAGTLRSRLVAEGHPLRVYVPFGERWHAYSMRRLRENPTIALHIIRNLFTRR